MEVRIEVGAERLDRSDTALAQRFHQLLVDQLDAAPDRLGRFGPRVGLEGALHVVDEREELFQQIRRRSLRQLNALALGALAVVVELGRLAQEPVVVLVPLLFQFRGIRGLRLIRLRCRCRLSSCFIRFVCHIRG